MYRMLAVRDCCFFSLVSSAGSVVDVEGIFVGCFVTVLLREARVVDVTDAKEPRRSASVRLTETETLPPAAALVVMGPRPDATDKVELRRPLLPNEGRRNGEAADRAPCCCGGRDAAASGAGVTEGGVHDDHDDHDCASLSNI